MTRVAVVVVLAAASASATPQDHEAHHAGQNTNTPAAAPEGRSLAPRPTPGGMASGDGGMGEMMEGMGAPPPRQIYPSMMDVPPLSEERRQQIERLAQVRMTASRERMAGALSRLSDAAARGDSSETQEASAELREALAEFESGLAAHRALAEGQVPRTIALEWFKRDMNLLPVAGSEPPHGFFGLSWFHYFVMAIMAAFAVAMVWMYFHKMRRAEVLLEQLASGAAPATPSPSPVVPPVAAARWSGQLRVARIFEETPDVKTVRFTDLEGGEFLPFTFDPGQFLTVSVPADGKEIKRSYSISSSPGCQGWCEITIKHVSGGLVSGYLHEQVREGDLLNVAGPSGRFTFRGKEAPGVVFIAGGVGVTPFMSSIRYLTDQSWPGEIFLIYASGSLKDIIFREELEYLGKRYPNLHVTITLSKEDSPAWTGPRGHVTKEMVLDAVPDIAARRVHICGPPPMMDAVKTILTEIGVPAEQVKSELFLSPEPRRAARAAAEPVSAVATTSQAAQAPVCTFARSGTTAPLPADKTVLEASEDVGVNIDSSCREGYCGVCKVRLLAGQVTLAVEDALDDQDRAQNIILACQARSTGDVAVDA